MRGLITLLHYKYLPQSCFRSPATCSLYQECRGLVLLLLLPLPPGSPGQLLLLLLLLLRAALTLAAPTVSLGARSLLLWSWSGAFLHSTKTENIQNYISPSRVGGDLSSFWLNICMSRASRIFSSGSQVLYFGLHPFHLTRYSVLPTFCLWRFSCYLNKIII